MKRIRVHRSSFLRIFRVLTLICFFQFSGLNNGFAYVQIISPTRVPQAMSLVGTVTRTWTGDLRQGIKPYAKKSFRFAVHVTLKVEKIVKFIVSSPESFWPTSYNGSRSKKLGIQDRAYIPVVHLDRVLAQAKKPFRRNGENGMTFFPNDYFNERKNLARDLENISFKLTSTTLPQFLEFEDFTSSVWEHLDSTREWPGRTLKMGEVFLISHMVSSSFRKLTHGLLRAIAQNTTQVMLKLPGFFFVEVWR